MTLIDNPAFLVQYKREKLGLTPAEFAELLCMGDSGENRVRDWETGRCLPTAAKIDLIGNLTENPPFKAGQGEPLFKFIDLFAGIGGIRLPFQQAGGRCVFSSEWDKYAKRTYAVNFGELPRGDITEISVDEIPDHDVLVAGFPCQAFSQAGLKMGFNDTRGTMFFEIQRILAGRRPKAFLLENVKQLRGHDKGRTLRTILAILRGQNETAEIPDGVCISSESQRAMKSNLDYWVDYRVLRAADFGVPQNRERIYIVGFRKDGRCDADFDKAFSWPTPPCPPTRLGDILEPSQDVVGRYTISDRMGEGHQKRREKHRQKGNGFGYSLFNEDSPYANTISARYWKDGSEILVDQSPLGRNPRTLTPRECARLQGFPENFIIDSVTKKQVFKQFGNSVAVPVVHSVCKEMTRAMRKLGMFTENKRTSRRKRTVPQESLLTKS
jgi:DNA (cytosine-5)-methyltransferase 1